jgi:mannitol-1-phosphate 5-dehydrogenase
LENKQLHIGSLNMTKRLLIIGAGSTGRGQVAQLAYESGWDLSLVDRNEKLVDAIRSAGKFTVVLYDPTGKPREVVISGYRAFHTSQVQAVADEIAAADLIVTSVIATNLPQVAPLLAESLRRRAEKGGAIVNVIAAENMEHSSTVLRDLTLAAWNEMEIPSSCEAGEKESKKQRRHGQDAHATHARTGVPLLDAVARFPDSMIARVVPIAADPLRLDAEEFSEWTVDGTVFAGPDPQIKTLELVPNQSARLERKLFIHNTGHATCAYWALRKGCRFVHEGARDPQIIEQVRLAIGESGSAVAAEHGFARDTIRAYEENLLGRLPGDAFVDGLDRVCREPLRKIGPQERLIGPINLCVKHGLPMDHLCRAVAVVLTTFMPGDPQYVQLKAMLAEGGPEKVLREVCQLAPEHPAHKLILNEYATLRASEALEDVHKRFGWAMKKLAE